MLRNAIAFVQVTIDQNTQHCVAQFSVGNEKLLDQLTKEFSVKNDRVFWSKECFQNNLETNVTKIRGRALITFLDFIAKCVSKQDCTLRTLINSS